MIMSATTPEIDTAMKNFTAIILNGVPILLQQNETARLSFVCMVTAIDALAGYRYPGIASSKRFQLFIEHYFPKNYRAHAPNLYIFRCRLLHNFSPAHFTLTHAASPSHLTPSSIGDTILSDDAFFADLRAAATNFFLEVEHDPVRQADMRKRLNDLSSGGTIY